MIMSKEKQLFYTIENGVMTITIDNIEMKNGLNYIGINQFADAYDVLNSDDSIKVAVIKGSNGYFFGGGRVDPNCPGENEKYADAIQRYMKACDDNKKPVIAAVNGTCYKAGLGTVAQADIAIAQKGVMFGLPEIRMGGIPMMIMVELMDYLPKKFAMEAYLSGWDFPAEDAYRIGLVNKVVEESEFDATVQKYVDVFLNTNPELIRLTRKAYAMLSAIDEPVKRQEAGMKMLREEVLPAMTRIEQHYNP